ncbi:fatty acid desaturase [Pseudomonas sp. HR96]|uniref:fatty acid desaturase n=1 Tax=Pseudomonas sp. HR96 TaxID=1027966 RepID=UPI002A750817|nr:fatty acid desaturase [Pseudomonas sp. HR96]WPP01954.1 fatty acid desaturase [Pseudomonas sp. HR96]
MSNYLDAHHRQQIHALQRSWTARSDWPTWLLLSATYSAWFALVLHVRELGQLATVALLVPVIVLWMSLQHELLHGHPSVWRWLNKLLGYAPFALWYPYTLYRDSHLLHHRDEALTRPQLDPESRYLDVPQWQRSGAALRGLHWLNKTLCGRLLVGPLLALGGLASGEWARLRRGDLQALGMWLSHGAWVGVLLWFVNSQGLAIASYVLATLLALAVSMVRSYYEHRPAAEPQQRSVLNEAGWPWRWLFLNLNLHLVHHDLPGLPWYYLPRVYAERREEWLARSGQFLVKGYAELFARHGLRPIDSPQHPWH